MSLSRVGSNTAAATTVTVPAHLPGDLICIWAMHTGAATIPTLPSGFLSPSNGTKANGAALGCRFGYKIANSTSDTSGTWTNATNLICVVYRPSGGSTLRVGDVKNSTSATATVTFPTLSMADGSGNSWVVGAIASSNTTQVDTTAPSGMTNVTSLVGAASQVALHDTNGGVSSWTSTTANVTNTGSSVSMVFEIVLATTSVPTSSNVYQHVGGGGLQNSRGLSANNFKIPLPAPSGAGNCYVLAIKYETGLTVSSVTGAVNGSFGAAAVGPVTADSTSSALYVLPNISAGQETITVVLSSTSPVFQYAITELYGVATSSVTNGSASTSLVTSPIATGSFTPGNNNANGGNFIWAHFAKGSNTPGTLTTALFPGANFTFLNHNTSWNSTDGMTDATQAFVQTTSAAINPKIVSINDTSDTWNCLAVALKISTGSGTPPSSGAQINKIDHFTTGSFPSSGTYQITTSSIGNARVVCAPDPNLNALTVRDSEGNTWDTRAATAGVWFLLNCQPNPNLVIYIDGGGGDNELSWRTYDISAPMQFDSFKTVADNPTGTSYTPANQPSPSNTNGLVIANIGLGTGPGLSVNTPSGAIWDLCTYSGETDIDSIENADIMAHYHNTASGLEAWNFTVSFSTSVSGGFIAFSLAPTVSVPSAAPKKPGLRLGTPFSRLQFDNGFSPVANPNVTLSLTGQVITSTEGTINEEIDYALTGQFVTSTEGTIAETISYSLTGQAIISTEGTIANAVSYALTGISITSAEGTIAPEVDYSLLGQSITTTEGTISRAGAAVPYNTLALRGPGLRGPFDNIQFIASPHGFSAPSPNVTLQLTGQSITSTEGAINETVSYSLIGQAITSTEGTIAETVSYGLTGLAINSTEGTISAAWSGSASLTGQLISTTEGSIGPEADYATSGQSVSSSPGSLGDEVDYGLSGQAITSSEGVITAQAQGDVSVTLSGLQLAIALGQIQVPNGAGRHHKRWKVMIGGRSVYFATKKEAQDAQARHAEGVLTPAVTSPPKRVKAREAAKIRKTEASKVKSEPAHTPSAPIPQTRASNVDIAQALKDAQMREEEEIAIALLLS